MSSFVRRARFVATTALPVIHLPDLDVDVLDSDERRQHLLIAQAVGIKHSRTKRELAPRSRRLSA